MQGVINLLAKDFDRTGFYDPLILSDDAVRHTFINKLEWYLTSACRGQSAGPIDCNIYQPNSLPYPPRPRQLATTDQEQAPPVPLLLRTAVWVYLSSVTF